MKLCRFDEDRLGVVIGDKVHDVSEAQGQIRASARYDMKGDAVIAALPAWRKRIEEMAARRDIPEAAKRQSPKIGQAGIFLKSNSAIVGPSEGIPLRFLDRLNEHEVELVVVIGKQGSDIPRDQAKDYIAGYTLGLDMTVRGPEDRSFRKSVDGYAVLGPWMVTADEIPNPDDMLITLHLNNELKQSADTKDLIYDVGRLIEFASSFYTLYPGEVTNTARPTGGTPVKPGDVLAINSAPIGAFEIKVRAHQIGG